MLYLVTEYANNGEIFGEHLNEVCVCNIYNFFFFLLTNLLRNSLSSWHVHNFCSCTRLYMQSLHHLLVLGVDPPTGLPVL